MIEGEKEGRGEGLTKNSPIGSGLKSPKRGSNALLPQQYPQNDKAAPHDPSRRGRRVR